MPTYDYYCEKCETTFEIFQSMNDKKLKKCIDQSCGGSVERLLGTGAGIIFKGSGFYETDYRSDSYKAGAKAEKDKKNPVVMTQLRKNLIKEKRNKRKILVLINCA